MEGWEGNLTGPGETAVRAARAACSPGPVERIDGRAATSMPVGVGVNV